MSKKLSLEQKTKIKEMTAFGMTTKEISLALKLNRHTVRYWADEEFRKRNIASATKAVRDKREKGTDWVSVNKEKQRDYIRGYMNDRYHNDEAFRKRMKESHDKYLQKLKEDPVKWEKHLEKRRIYSKANRDKEKERLCQTIQPQSEPTEQTQ